MKAYITDIFDDGLMIVTYKGNDYALQLPKTTDSIHYKLTGDDYYWPHQAEWVEESDLSEEDAKLLNEAIMSIEEQFTDLELLIAFKMQTMDFEYAYRIGHDGYRYVVAFDDDGDTYCYRENPYGNIYNRLIRYSCKCADNEIFELIKKDERIKMNQTQAE